VIGERSYRRATKSFKQKGMGRTPIKGKTVVRQWLVPGEEGKSGKKNMPSEVGWALNKRGEKMGSHFCASAGEGGVKERDQRTGGGLLVGL